MQSVVLLAPCHYGNAFAAGNPVSARTDNPERAFNGDTRDPVVWDTSGETSASVQYFDMTSSTHVVYMLIDTHNMFTVMESSGYSRMYYDIFYAGTYSQVIGIETVYGGAHEGGSNAVVVDSNDNILVEFTGVTHSKFRFAVWAGGNFLGDVSVGNLWVGQGYAPDAIYSLGRSQELTQITHATPLGLSGVPYPQYKENDSGRTVRSHTLVWEWLDELDLDDLLSLYRTCGTRPFKMAVLDGSAYADYTVVFTQPPSVQRVDESHSTVTLELGET